MIKKTSIAAKALFAAVAAVMALTMSLSNVYAGYRPLVDNNGTALPGQVNHITGFSVPGEILAPLQETDGTGVAIWVTKTIAAEPLASGNPGEVMFRMPEGTDVTHLTPTITVSDGATISPESGVPQDFTNPVTYTVTSSAATGSQVARWVVTCYVNNKAAKLTSDNAALQQAFAWAVNKTNQFAVTGKWALHNKYGTNYTDATFNGSGPAKGETTDRFQYFKCFPAYWAGYFNRTAYCPRDSSHGTVGGQLAGWIDENWNMYYTYAQWAAKSTGTRLYNTIWQVNFDGTPNYVDYTNTGNFRIEGPSNFDLVENAYNIYKWTGDSRFVNDPTMWNFIKNTCELLPLDHDAQPPNGVVDRQNMTTAGYNERFGSITATETGDTLASQYQAYLAYASMLKDKGDAANSKIWADKAAALKDYFNNDWSVGPQGPQGEYIGAIAYDAASQQITKVTNFSREPHMFMTYKTIVEPSDRANRLLKFVSDSLQGGVKNSNSNYYSPMANLESYTYAPEGFWRYDQNELAWRWMMYIYGRKDMAHEVAMQGTNGDYPEMSYTFISQTVEGMMGIVPDAPNNWVATGPRLPGATTNPDTGAAIAGVNWVDMKDIRLGDRLLDVRHDGKTQTTLTNHAGAPLTWEARFPGRYTDILVDADNSGGFVSMPANAIDVNGVPYSAVDITVAANGTAVAKVGAVIPAHNITVSGKIAGDDITRGIPAAIKITQMGGTVLTLTAGGDGTYSFSLPQGKYTMYADMTGYSEGTAAINLDLADLAGENIILTRDYSGLSLTLDQTAINLSYGGGTTSRTLIPTLAIYPEDNQGVVWSSSNEQAATVDANGTVTATGVGAATITAASAEYGSAVSASCAVTVLQYLPVESISLPATATATMGNPFTLTPVYTPAATSEKNVTWSSSNTAVATVDANGAVTPLSPGFAAITCVSDSNPLVSAVCKLTVTQPMNPIRTPFVTSKASGDATDNTQNPTVKSNAGSFSKSNDSGIYYVQDGTNPNPIGMWMSIDVNVPATGLYKVDFIYKAKSDNTNSTVQAYMGYNPTQTADVAVPANALGAPLDMRLNQQAAMGATDVTFQIGCTNAAILHRYLDKTLADSVQLQQGWNTFKIVLTANPQRWGVLPVSVSITPQAPPPAPVWTVAFDPNGGTLASPAAAYIADGGQAAQPADPARSGYTFGGWALNGAPYDFASPVTADITLTAQWTLIPPATYTVTFDAAGGSPTPPAQTVTSGGMAIKPANPTKTGYTFDGWFASGAAAAYDFGTPVTADLNLTAKWTLIPSYTVTFDAAGGSPNPPAQTVTSGGTAAKPANPTKTGYTFDGWFASGAAAAYDFSTPVTADLTLTAKWTLIPSYTVTFDAAGGSPIPPTQTVTSGGTATAPTAPTKTDYTFAGWYLGGTAYNFSTPVTANITLVAQWTPAGQYVPPTNITMSAAQTSLNMKVGTKLSLQITVSPANANPSVTWSSSNPAVATVDPVTGQVTAVKTGSVRITVKSNADPTVSYMFLVMINA